MDMHQYYIHYKYKGGCGSTEGSVSEKLYGPDTFKSIGLFEDLISKKLSTDVVISSWTYIGFFADNERVKRRTHE